MIDLHTHSVYSDGKHSLEEMIRAAIGKGLTRIGLSDHSHTEGDPCGMTYEGTEAYRMELKRLKEKYAGQIQVYCGLERDYYSDDTLEYDYVIGSVHWLKMPDGHRLAVDWMAEKQREGVEKYYRGDWYAFAEEYYELVGRVAEVTKCDIIGHFDLVTKFVEQDPWVDLRHPRYVAAWQRAADALIKTGKPFEINTGAISRGYRTEPYPAPEIREYLRQRGVALILSSDAHACENIAYQFDHWQKETFIPDGTFSFLDRLTV